MQNRTEKIESLPLEKIEENKVRLVHKKIIEIENTEDLTLDDLLGRKKSIEKAITQTQERKAADTAGHDIAIANLNMQLTWIDEQIDAAKNLGLKEEVKD